MEKLGRASPRTKLYNIYNDVFPLKHLRQSREDLVNIQIEDRDILLKWAWH